MPAPYERLEAWKLCHQLTVAVYRVTARFPKEELYGLTSKARRAATSAPLNIAEGSAKKGPREFRRYLDTARGSLAELEYVLLLSCDLGLLSAEAHAEMKELANRAGFLTWRLYRSVARAKGIRGP